MVVLSHLGDEKTPLHCFVVLPQESAESTHTIKLHKG